MTIALKNKTEFKFGDYAIIEQKRHGVPNDMFVHKVIDQLRSNTWVDVPVQSPATETIHDEMEDVCWCICCGVSETEVRKYRVKDMRRHSPVSAVTDEKKGSTITLQAVNELIASLESAGELSIREQKFLKLAKEFRICSASLDTAIKTGNVLADQNAQLAAENVGLKKFIKTECFVGQDKPDICLGLVSTRYVSADGYEPETPATDRIVAEAEARGVEKFAAHLRANDNGASVCKMIALGADDFAKQLREGAK